MKLIAAALLLAACATLSAAEVDSEGRIVLTEQEKAQCSAGGGCLVMPAKLLDKLIERLGQCTRWDAVSFTPEKSNPAHRR
jgi:hypothetical protein